MTGLKRKNIRPEAYYAWRMDRMVLISVDLGLMSSSVCNFAVDRPKNSVAYSAWLIHTNGLLNDSVF